MLCGVCASSGFIFIFTAAAGSAEVNIMLKRAGGQGFRHLICVSVRWVTLWVRHPLCVSVQLVCLFVKKISVSVRWVTLWVRPPL